MKQFTPKQIKELKTWCKLGNIPAHFYIEKGNVELNLNNEE